jgi:3'-phosphoadenosine 5'-phosphosulfate sulfotransferase (PAPS reductase)/FAD synthetase
MTFRIPASARGRLRGRPVVASLSGGKDSTALALLLREAEIPHVRIFADTGFEHPTTYDYLELLRERLGEITTVRNEALWRDARPGEEGMLTLIRRKQMFPSRQRRFCTELLKLAPVKAYLDEVDDEVVNAVGVRADESASRARMPEWEWSEGLDVEVWRPLLSATFADVVEIHRRHNMPPNPLYLEGARRVGCNPCIFSGKHDVRQIAHEQLVKIRRVEQDLTAAAVVRGRDRPTRAFFQVRGPGPARRLAFTPIDEVFEQAHTVRGRAWDPAGDPPGCRRWGLCEGGDGG